MLEISDTKWRWRVNPKNNRAVQVKPNQHGARWIDFETYDCPAIAREVVLACQGLKPEIEITIVLDEVAARGQPDD